MKTTWSMYRAAVLLSVVSVPAWATPPGTVAAAAAPAEKARDGARDALLESAFPDGQPSARDGRVLFTRVLQSERFLHEAVGPFDLYVYKADGLAKSRTAKKTLKSAAEGLASAAAVVERTFSREEGLISGRRFPIVLTSQEGEKERAFDEVLALLDHCEDLGFSGWKPVNDVWSAKKRRAEVVRTWEVSVFNLADERIDKWGRQWFEHALGYHTIAHVTNRLLRQGAWGMAPPWLAQGLIDELDIQAHGDAWVGGDWWQRQTPGWHRAGWSGFVPKGQRPPQPVTGPPANLATTVRNSGNSWAHRKNSATRHWKDLRLDRDSEAPASFRFMAEHESFMPRDRAYARCVMHMMLEIAQRSDQGLLELLDVEPSTPPDGMPQAEPLTAVFAAALGGVPEVQALEEMSLGEMLEAIQRDDIADTIRGLGAKDMLGVVDHRTQSKWLYGRSKFDMTTRGMIFNQILEAEYYQQLHEWSLIGAALDRAANAALSVSRTFPKREKDAQKVAGAFAEALGR